MGRNHFIDVIQMVKIKQTYFSHIEVINLDFNMSQTKKVYY